MPNKYDHEYRVQAIKLAKELGSVNQAARELGISRDTLNGWSKAVREGHLDIGEGAHTPESALTLNEELIKLRKQVKEQEKEIKRLKEVIIHSDRGSQYTSEEYRSAIHKYDIAQSMNSARGRCHDNARCEIMWARLKSELLYDRHKTEQMSIAELKTLIWRYFMIYWNNRRI